MNRTITVFRGDGIGPEITDAVLRILKAADAPLDYEIFEVGEAEWKRNGELIHAAAYKSFEKTRVLLNAPITTPVGTGFRSLNVTLRTKYQLYANIRPIKSNAAVKTPYPNV
ncbi:MAG: NAD-dependent isocitrate dehydrogenase, partial [Clostridium sp.]|nr:NAD-dependent isocitrate dehydrogenase [Clostridium sp.]